MASVLAENDTDPDTRNHDWYGIFVMSGGDAPARARVEGLSIYDVCRTVLGLFGVAGPADLLGTGPVEMIAGGRVGGRPRAEMPWASTHHRGQSNRR